MCVSCDDGQLENFTQQVEMSETELKLCSIGVMSVLQYCSRCRTDWWLQHILMDLMAIGCLQQVSVYCTYKFCFVATCL